MLDKDTDTRDTLRMFLSEVQRYEIDNKETVSDSKALQIINKMIKQRNDSIKQFENGGRIDLADKEKLEVSILNKYKPEQLKEDEIKDIVLESISKTNSNSMQDMGKVMSELKTEIDGKADMGLVSKIVRDLLSN